MAEYTLKIESYNGKDGWIRGAIQKSKEEIDNDPNLIAVDQETYDNVEPADPSTVQKAPRWDGKKVIMDETGANIPPEPTEAKVRLLTKAETPETDGGWGWSRSKVRTLRTDHALMFDFIEARNYPEAKNEATHAEDEGIIDTEQRDWIYDMLSGRI